MAKKKSQSEELKQLKSQLLSGKVVVGMDCVMKNLKSGVLKRIFIASNCRQDVREDLHHYAKLQDVEVVDVDLSNEELGILCKKNFMVSVVGTTEI